MRLAFSIGVLVLAGVGLVVGAVLFLTRGDIGREGVAYETYFRESVQGLDVGASVRFRGVAIGRVTDIGLVSARYRRPAGDAFPDAFQLVYVRFTVDMRQIGDAPPVQQAVELGLRTRLASQGLTGVGYIELDFVDVRRFPTRAPPWQADLPVIPSTPSTTAQVQSAAERLLERLEQLDLAELLSGIAGIVQDMRRFTAPQGELGTLMAEATGTMRSLRGSVEQAGIAAAVAEFQATATAARALLESRELRQGIAQGDAAMSELRAAAARLPPTIQQLEAGVRSARAATLDLQADMVPILRDLRAVTANLREVTEALRRNPSQTLLGAPPPAGGAR
jgi:ABC-type transporter Mla subunit MlaD